MREQTETTIPAKKGFYTIYKCELCGAELDSRGGRKKTPDAYNHEVCEIKAEQGNNWPGEGWASGVATDVCFDCFMQKVKPALEQMGIKFYKHEHDW